MKKKIGLIGTILLLSLVLFGGLSYATNGTGSFTVINPGPLDSPSITTTINNNDTFDLLRADFDSSGTTATGGGGGPLVFDALIATTDPTGGTSTFTQDSPTQWHFDFTSFNFGDFFSFGWDPDTATDSSYEASVAELAGLSVMLTTTDGVVSGTMQIVGNDVSATIASPAVPEPSTFLLLCAGLAGVGIMRRRFKK